MKFVAVKEFDDYISAHIIMGRLSDEDIVCHLENEYFSSGSFFINGSSP